MCFHTVWTGNGYGDGRAMSVVELVANGQCWEMQLKGGGRTPYCRGADGRALLRSSVREFLAQELMHALGVSTSSSLSLIMSTTGTVERPWYLEGSTSVDPEILVLNPVAIITRVAPSFLRVGQLELFVSLRQLMARPPVDYTMFFRELSQLPGDIAAISKSFYKPTSEALLVIGMAG